MLEAVRPLVLEREVEQRREVAGPHDGREQRSTTTTGNDRRRTTAEWSTGRIQRRRDLGRRGLEEQGDRSREQQERRPDERQQQVLDHVHREQRRVVGGEPGVDARYRTASTPDHPVGRPAAGDRVGRMRPVRAPDARRPTAAARAIAGSQASGSNDQPNTQASRRPAAPGPWRRGRGRPPGAASIATAADAATRQARTGGGRRAGRARGGARRRRSRAHSRPSGPMRSASGRDGPRAHAPSGMI